MPRLMPTGECWCGCGEETTIGSFFLAGHDKVAESAIVIVEYGSVPEFIREHGYGPGGKNPRTEANNLRTNSDQYRENVRGLKLPEYDGKGTSTLRRWRRYWEGVMAGEPLTPGSKDTREMAPGEIAKLTAEIDAREEAGFAGPDRDRSWQRA